MTQDPFATNQSNIMDLPAARNTSIPIHEILSRVATAVSADFTDQLPGLDLTEVKTALEYAAAVIRQQNIQPEVDTLSPPNVLDPKNAGAELNLNKVLVVDDVEQNRLLMKHMLSRSGFTPILAASGDEAFEKARAELPALIVSDIMMPGVTGLDLLERLKADELTRGIAVILVTAHYRDSKRISQGLNMGAYDYIQRPFLIDEFVSRVKAVMRIKQAEAEKQRQARVVKQRNRGLNLVNELALAVNSSPDMQHIFTSSIQNLSQLLEADAVSLLLLDEEEQQLTVNISSSSQKFVSVVIDSDKLPLAEVPDIVCRVIDEHRDTLGIKSPPDAATVQYVPVHSREWQAVGAIAIVNKRGQSFNDADWILLHSAGNIIAVAVENVHLLENAQQQVDDLIALNDIGLSLSSTLELDQTFAHTTGHVQNLLHAEVTSLWVLDETDQTLKLLASSNGNATLEANPYFAVYVDIVNSVAETGEAYLSADVLTDRPNPQYPPDSSIDRPRSILGVPAKFEDKIIGVILSTHPKSNRFNQNHLRLSYPIANSVGTALKNTQLFGKVQEFNNFLEQMVETRTKQLAEEKEKIETILSNMADGMLVLDANNHILMANTAAEDMLDFKLPQLLGQPIDPGQMETPLWRSINEIASDSNPTVTVTVDVPAPQSDKKSSIEAHSAKVQGEAGQIIGTVIVLRDITALKEVEQMKSRFMAGVTHELKTPLAIIQLHANNLSTYYNRLPEEKRSELLQAIQNQVKLLKQLIENILHLSRYDSGMISTKHHPVGAVKLIEQIVADLRPLAVEKQITLNWQKPEKEITIMASAIQIERVVRNLIDNAIKYTPPHQSVTVDIVAEQTGQQHWVKIRVADTGIGISPEHQPRIFERFYRVDPSHTVPGSGLGLSIVKEIVNLHKGAVTLKSTPGAGSTFTVTLPVIA